MQNRMFHRRRGLLVGVFGGRSAVFFSTKSMAFTEKGLNKKIFFKENSL